MPTLQLNDLPLFYQDSGNADKVLLALHPATVSGTLFQWALPKNGRYRTLLPDQRGHGKTPNPAPDFHLHRMVRDMWDFVDTLGIETLHGIGYSMGAGVLMGMAILQPTRFERLILIGAHHRAPSQDQLTQIAGPPQSRTGLVLEVMHPERGFAVGRDFDLGALGRLDFPIALIGGDHDPVAPLVGYQELYQRLPKGQLLIVPDTDHFGYHNNPLVEYYLQMLYDE